MIRVCKVKLGRAYKQEAKLLFVFELCRRLYNAALEQRIDAYRKQNKTLSFYEQCKELTQLRDDDDFYKSLPVEMTRLSVLDRLDKAFKSFFRRLKSGDKPGFPRFKGRERFSTLAFGKAAWKIDNKKLILNIKGNPIVLTMRNQIYRNGEIKGLRIVQSGNRFWAQFLVDIGEAPKAKPSENGIGIDVGIRTFATLSNGDQVEHPKFMAKDLGCIQSIQQSLSSKKKGSNNRRKAKAVLSLLFAKMKNRRDNFLHQTTSQLLSTYDGFAVENLNIKSMLKDKGKGKKTLHRNVLDSSWDRFIFMLAYKAEEAGKPIVKVNPRGTSQRYSSCDTIVKKGLEIRIHDCPVCGLKMDRDHNAALNIVKLAKNDLGYRLVPLGTEVLS